MAQKLRCTESQFKMDGKSRPMFQIRRDTDRDQDKPWFSFGYTKARAILQFWPEIKAFVDRNKPGVSI